MTDYTATSVDIVARHKTAATHQRAGDRSGDQSEHDDDAE